MSKETIKTDKAPAPIGPYNQATVLGNLVFCSGQIPLDPATGELETGDVAAQTKLVMENLQAVLFASGSSYKKVLKTTIFLADMDDFPTVNAVYGEYFAEPLAPARSTVQVGRLPKDVKVEIDAIAFR